MAFTAQAFCESVRGGGPGDSGLRQRAQFSSRVRPTPPPVPSSFISNSADLVSRANLPPFPWTLKSSDEEMDSRWCHDPTIPSSLRATSLLLTEGGEGKGRRAPSRGQKLPEAAACSAVWGPGASGSQGLVGGASLTPSRVEVVPLSILVGWRPTGMDRGLGETVNKGPTLTVHSLASGPEINQARKERGG